MTNKRMLSGICDTLYERMIRPGLLMTTAKKNGEINVMTIGWGQFGSSFVGNPIFIAAVTPRRYTWYFLEEIPEFVVGVPSDGMKDAVSFCGTRSGREVNKFKETGLTPVPSSFVKPPSIKECIYNLECRIYSRCDPPHTLVHPGVKNDDHTIYFAEVLTVSKT